MDSLINVDKACPCGKTAQGEPLTYQSCCKPLHSVLRVASTPEELMRSRYSAYYFALGQYIFDTHHADFRGNTTVEEFSKSAENTDWCRLEVVSSSHSNDSGQVEFKASFIDGDKLHTLHEASNFVRQHGVWLYTDGDFKPRKAEKINRNQSCPCGSGHKAKRCCL